VETAMTEAVPEELRQRLTDAIPLSRRGQPDDIAGPVAFLCSDQASYITGATLDVNGGVVMR
jgi:3-oxoacyl-[acyl-carrier protein] reductase